MAAYEVIYLHEYLTFGDIRGSGSGSVFLLLKYGWITMPEMQAFQALLVAPITHVTFSNKLCEQTL